MAWEIMAIQLVDRFHFLFRPGQIPEFEPLAGAVTNRLEAAVASVILGEMNCPWIALIVDIADQKRRGRGVLRSRIGLREKLRQKPWYGNHCQPAVFEQVASRFRAGQNGERKLAEGAVRRNDDRIGVIQKRLERLPDEFPEFFTECGAVGIPGADDFAIPRIDLASEFVRGAQFNPMNWLVRPDYKSQQSPLGHALVLAGSLLRIVRILDEIDEGRVGRQHLLNVRRPKLG